MARSSASRDRRSSPYPTARSQHGQRVRDPARLHQAWGQDRPGWDWDRTQALARPQSPDECGASSSTACGFHGFWPPGFARNGHPFSPELATLFHG